MKFYEVKAASAPLQQASLVWRKAARPSAGSAINGEGLAPSLTMYLNQRCHIFLLDPDCRREAVGCASLFVCADPRRLSPRLAQLAHSCLLNRLIVSSRMHQKAERYNESGRVSRQSVSTLTADSLTSTATAAGGPHDPAQDPPASESQLQCRATDRRATGSRHRCLDRPCWLSRSGALALDLIS